MKYILKQIKLILKCLFTRLTCKHEYEFRTDFSYRNKETNERYHDITIKCKKCGKFKDLPIFTKNNNE